MSYHQTNSAFISVFVFSPALPPSVYPSFPSAAYNTREESSDSQYPPATIYGLVIAILDNPSHAKSSSASIAIATWTSSSSSVESSNKCAIGDGRDLSSTVPTTAPFFTTVNPLSSSFASFFTSSFTTGVTTAFAFFFFFFAAPAFTFSVFVVPAVVAVLALPVVVAPAVAPTAPAAPAALTALTALTAPAALTALTALTAQSTSWSQSHCSRCSASSLAGHPAPRRALATRTYADSSSYASAAVLAPTSSSCRDTTVIASSSRTARVWSPATAWLAFSIRFRRARTRLNTRSNVASCDSDSVTTSVAHAEGRRRREGRAATVVMISCRAEGKKKSSSTVFAATRSSRAASSTAQPRVYASHPLPHATFASATPRATLRSGNAMRTCAAHSSTSVVG